jgi:hypothetical protein
MKIGRGRGKGVERERYYESKREREKYKSLIEIKGFTDHFLGGEILFGPLIQQQTECQAVWASGHSHSKIRRRRRERHQRRREREELRRKLVQCDGLIEREGGGRLCGQNER